MRTKVNLDRLNPPENYSEDVSHILARAYKFILSWPDPENKPPAGSENFGEDTEPAVKGASTEKSNATKV